MNRYKDLNKTPALCHAARSSYDVEFRLLNTGPLLGAAISSVMSQRARTLAQAQTI